MCSALLCPLLHYHTAPAKMFAATLTLYIVLSTRADFGGIHLLCSHTITPYITRTNDTRSMDRKMI